MLRKICALLAAGIAAALFTSLLGPSQADAKTYKWNNTVNSGTSKRTLKVKYCNGDMGTLKPNTSTTKDVCAFWWPYDAYMDIFVPQTGTQLFDGENCKKGRWQYFDSKTDTSRTANVGITWASCAADPA